MIFWERTSNLFEFNKNFDEWLISYHAEVEKTLINELISLNLHSKQNTYSVSKARTESVNNTYSVSEINLLGEAGKASTEHETGSPTTSIITSNYNTMSSKQDELELLEYFNDKAGKSYKPIESNLKQLRGRLGEYSKDEIKSVIDFKVREWGKDKIMSKYLRPETLFNATKCAGYVEESKKKEESGDYVYNGFA